MKHILFVGIAMMALVGCDIPGLGNERPGSDGDARATAGEATELVDAMAGRNRLPIPNLIISNELLHLIRPTQHNLDKLRFISMSSISINLNYPPRNKYMSSINK